MKTAVWCYFPLSAGMSPHGLMGDHAISHIMGDIGHSATWPVQGAAEKNPKKRRTCVLYLAWIFLRRTTS
jgi:hypothetical protein